MYAFVVLVQFLSPCLRRYGSNTFQQLCPTSYTVQPTTTRLGTIGRHVFSHISPTIVARLIVVRIPSRTLFPGALHFKSRRGPIFPAPFIAFQITSRTIFPGAFRDYFQKKFGKFFWPGSYISQQKKKFLGAYIFKKICIRVCCDVVSGVSCDISSQPLWTMNWRVLCRNSTAALEFRSVDLHVPIHWLCLLRIVRDRWHITGPSTLHHTLGRARRVFDRRWVVECFVGLYLRRDPPPPCVLCLWWLGLPCLVLFRYTVKTNHFVTVSTPRNGGVIRPRTIPTDWSLPSDHAVYTA